MVTRFGLFIMIISDLLPRRKVIMNHELRLIEQYILTLVKICPNLKETEPQNRGQKAAARPTIIRTFKVYISATIQTLQSWELLLSLQSLICCKLNLQLY